MKINDIVNWLISNLQKFNSNLDQIINHFYSGYLPDRNLPYLAAMVPLFLKIIFYILIAIVPFLFSKLLHPFNGKYSTIAITGALLTITILIFGIFLAFIQLLFSFDVS